MNSNYISIVSLVASFFAVVISYREYLLSKKKLNLDLYNKRFEVYRAILGFYEALYFWTGSEANEQHRQKFAQAAQEAQFLFKKEDGIEDLIERLNKVYKNVFSLQAWIDEYQNNKSISGSVLNAGVETRKSLGDLGTEMAKLLPELQQKMRKYLDFSDVSG